MLHKSVNLVEFRFLKIELNLDKTNEIINIYQHYSKKRSINRRKIKFELTLKLSNRKNFKHVRICEA